MHSQATVNAQFSHLIGLLSLSQHTSAEGKSTLMESMSESATVGDDVPCSAVYYWIFFLLTKQATNKLASG